MTDSTISWVETLSEECLQIQVDVRLYSLEALFRVCYVFTDNCYLFLSPSDDLGAVTVHFSRKIKDSNLATIAALFSNELINQRVRSDIARETKEIRELIVAQAFTEASLIDRSESESSYLDDPRGIGAAK